MEVAEITSDEDDGEIDVGAASPADKAGVEQKKSKPKIGVKRPADDGTQSQSQEPEAQTDFTFEFLGVAMIFAYIAVYFQGLVENECIAKQFMAEVRWQSVGTV